MRARDLAADWPGRDGPGVVLVPLLMLILLRAAQLKMKPPLEWCLGALELDDRLSQEGRKAETRCMAGDRAPLSVVAAVARAKTRQRGSVATEEDRPSNAAYFASLCILVEMPYFWKRGRDPKRMPESVECAIVGGETSEALMVANGELEDGLCTLRTDGSFRGVETAIKLEVKVH